MPSRVCRGKHCFGTINFLTEASVFKALVRSMTQTLWFVWWVVVGVQSLFHDKPNFSYLRFSWVVVESEFRQKNVWHYTMALIIVFNQQTYQVKTNLYLSITYLELNCKIEYLTVHLSTLTSQKKHHYCTSLIIKPKTCTVVGDHHPRAIEKYCILVSWLFQIWQQIFCWAEGPSSHH